MKLKRIFNLCLSTAICFILFTGCGNTKSSISADLSYTQSDIGTISVSSDVQIVGLGEASHGVAQYHQMKLDVFKALVENNGCHTFIIEGDFGGALKVDQYINGGNGTAEEVVAEIGFAIYRTQEMADLVDWMRSYNETVSEKEALHFYGMDVQRFDNNKEYLFSVIDQTHPELSAEYSEVFAQLTDENRNSLDEAALNSAKESVSEFIEKLDTVETDIVDSLGQPAFDFAKECAKTIYACCEVQLSDNYNATRDQYMYEKVEWFLQHGDNTVLFINGHNGHIGKSSVAGFDMAQHIVSGAAGVIGGSTSIDVAAALSSMQAGLDAMEIPELLLLMLETSLVSLCMKIMSVLITVVLYGRMIEIYLYCSVSPIPFATMTNREWGQIGNNYLKGLFALGFQGFLIMICVGIYAVLVNNMVIADNLHTAIFSIAAYTVLLCFNLLKSGALAKSLFHAH